MNHINKNSEHNFLQALRDVQHFGEQGGVVPVIDMAATSTFLNPKDMEKTFHGELQGCYLYSRHSNPTVDMFGKKIAALEGLPAALGVSSGMAAIDCTLRQLMPRGGHILSSHTVYGGTYALMKNLLPQSGIETTFVDINNLEALTKSLKKETQVVYVETMSNPLLRIPDFKKINKFCVEHNLKLVVDNTFTPVLVQPARWGADVVIYSCTKYISGASDMIAGAIVSSQEFINQLIDIHHGVVMLCGPVMDPRIAHELYLRLDHLPVRMQAHSRYALELAQNLKNKNVPVQYPGLESHPDHHRFKEIYNSQFGFGGMLVVDCGTVEKAFQLAQKLQDEKFGLCAVSLGFSRNLISCPAVSTSSEIPADEQSQIGLSAGLLRLSIGFTGDPTIMTKRFLKCWNEL